MPNEDFVLTLLECRHPEGQPLYPPIIQNLWQGQWSVRRSLCHPLPHLNNPPLPLQHFDNGRHLPHVGDRGFFEGHGVAFGALVAHVQ